MITTHPSINQSQLSLSALAGVGLSLVLGGKDMGYWSKHLPKLVREALTYSTAVRALHVRLRRICRCKVIIILDHNSEQLPTNHIFELVHPHFRALSQICKPREKLLATFNQLLKF